MKNTLLAKTLRYYHTLKYLKPIQLYGQLKFRLRKPKVKSLPTPARRSLHLAWVSPIPKAIHLRASNQLTLLNQHHDISAPSIWQDVKLDKLWLYNLHYFDNLNSPLVQDGKLIKRWIQENPPTNGNGWEPYPISLRIVNWIKWVLAGNSPDSEMMASLALQTHYLGQRLEIHILGNHLLANAKALIFAGCFFQGDRPTQWLATGLKYYTQQLRAQILQDGGHFELSPMYHAIILEDLLDVINVLKTYGQPIPLLWLAQVKEMFHWLQALVHPDQEIAFFNDATLDIAPNLQQLSAYAARLQLTAPTPSHAALQLLADSGFARLQLDNAVLLTDIGAVGASYQPGHAHADTLSFEFSLGQQRVLVNSGISTYVDNASRAHQRSTMAHNTAVINDRNSSEVWKSFRVAKRARTHNIKTSALPNQLTISACHDGYHTPYKITHHRSWQLSTHKLLIEDSFTGSKSHKISLYFHLHPTLRPHQTDANIIVFYDSSNQAVAILSSTLAIKIMESTYHPGFNLSIPNTKLVIDTTTALPTRITTFITWKF
jgi:uncharacterized heparinase superfamily protein